MRSTVHNDDLPRRAPRGFTLIEVLVALVVLAIGLLGVASLQITSKRGNLEAQQRAQAVLLAEDLLERMRANADSLGEYPNQDGDNDGVFIIDTTDGDEEVVAIACFEDGVGPAVSCTGDQIAQYDLDTFEAALTGTSETLAGSDIGGLASAIACLSGDSAGSAGLYTVAIAWRGLDDLPTPTLSDCGQGNAIYTGDGDITDNDGERSYRRVITVTAYITPDE